MTPFQKESQQMYDKAVEELKTRDRNKDWPTATREAPIKCSCGKQLEKPKTKYKVLMEISSAFPKGLVSSFNGDIRIDCKCGICYLWSFPNVWKRTHLLSEMYMFVEENGSLLRPKRVDLIER